MLFEIRTELSYLHMMNDQQPVLSIIMPMFNEAKYIAATLDSLRTNTYPSELFEVLVVNGSSRDDSASIVKTKQSEMVNLRLIESHTHNTPTNVNLGLEHARGKYVLFLSAHTIYEPDFLASLMESYQRHQCSVLGGVIGYQYNNIIGWAIKCAWSSKIGSGDSAYKVTKEVTEADSAFCCVFPRQLWVDVGKFDERLSCNQDYEFNIRVRNHGHKILIDPKITVKYNVKSSFVAHARQYWRYGWFRLYTIAKWPSSMKPRQILPSIIVFTLAISLILGLLGFVTTPLLLSALLIPLGYMGLCLYNGYKSATAESNPPPILGLFVAVAIMLMHLSYGAGMIFSFFSLRWRIMLKPSQS